MLNCRFRFAVDAWKYQPTVAASSSDGSGGAVHACRASHGSNACSACQAANRFTQCPTSRNHTGFTCTALLYVSMCSCTLLVDIWMMKTVPTTRQMGAQHRSGVIIQNTAATSTERGARQQVNHIQHKRRNDTRWKRHTNRSRWVRHTRGGASHAQKRGGLTVRHAPHILYELVQRRCPQPRTTRSPHWRLFAQFPWEEEEGVL